MSRALMVVASLIATMAFQVAVSPPGGVWQDDGTSQSNTVATGSTSNPSHKAGFSILADNDASSYGVFLAFNTTVTAMALTYLFVLFGLSDLDAAYNDGMIVLFVWFGLVGILVLLHIILLIVKIVKYVRKSQ
ncbi:hypothetical protein LWI28_019723 [Acer negundo]|uniref:PGG domain-containing protein n=1 Tax=Acer negundo TaxID=4023 RepID=A0AAD5JBA8_ACENE|nr:hypothetical protein LWI28_019723 [Acer negundo]